MVTLGTNLSYGYLGEHASYFEHLDLMDRNFSTEL
jgi:hypothetical protein